VQPGGLVKAITRSLPLTIQPQADLKFQLFSWLREKEVLLILDNFDHAGDEQLLNTLLQVAPGVSMITTSPRWLKVWGEHVVVIRGLTLPPSAQPEEMEMYSAVQLFLHYAQRNQPRFTLKSCTEREALLTLCRMVGNLPLGLELIAYLLPTYSLPEIALRVKRDPDFLASAMYQLPGRHCSMASVFNEVWQQLSAEEQTAFSRLCEFEEPFSVQDATDIAQVKPDVLFALQTNSLVQTVNCPLRTDTAVTCYEIMPIFRHYGHSENLRQQT